MPAAIKNAPTAKAFLGLNQVPMIPIGMPTKAIVRGAEEANQPAAPRLMANACIRRGKSGPADAQIKLLQERIKHIKASITNR